MKQLAFSVEQRERVRNRILEMARADTRIVAGAVVGSQALGPGDRWSDLDLTFGLADGVAALEVLGDWSKTLADEFAAIHLFDLPHMGTLYRVFLLPGTLQVDVSFTPGAQFGALGPKFKLLFGTAVERAFPTPPSARHRFGLAAHDAPRVRFSIERGRLWEAAYLIADIRNEAMDLACLRLGLQARYGRGHDQLPAEIRAAGERALVRSVDRAELLRALGEAIELLLAESSAAPDIKAEIEPMLRGLMEKDWPGQPS
jgi:hypothetical protein